MMLLLSTAILLFFFYWFTLSEWATHPWSLAVISIILIVIMTRFLQSCFGLPFMRRPIPLEPKPGMRVAMITTFVSDAEPLNMLEETVRAMVAVDYPHDIWVLDEGDDPAVKDLCNRLWFKWNRATHKRKAEAGL